MEALTKVYGSQGRYAEAEPLLVKTLEARRRVLGPDHRDTQTSLALLGFLYAYMGRTAEAERLTREVLDIREQALGENHPETLTSMRNLMKFLMTQGRYEEAEPIMTELMDRARGVFGDRHPYISNLVSEVGIVYKGLGRYDDAVAFYETDLRVCRINYGLHAPRTWQAMRWLVDIYPKIGRSDAAAALGREFLPHLPSDAADPNATPMSMFTKAWILTRDVEALRDPDRAADFARRAVDLAERSHKRALHNYLDLLALALHQTGDTAAAIEAQKRALAVFPQDNESGRKEFQESLDEYRTSLGNLRE